MTNTKRQAGEWIELRRRMVDEQIRSRGVREQRVLDAMAAIPREKFVPEGMRAAAYEDRALPIQHGQTISQPFIVAYMTEQLSVTPEDRVLEIGTGTGYQTAILALLCKHIFTVERIKALRERAAENLAAVNIANATLCVGDGSVGLRTHAPFDRILVTAAAPRVPPSLTEQLVDDGVLVIPVGGAREQTIVRVVREGRRTIETPTLACRFVKLIGREGWYADKQGE